MRWRSRRSADATGDRRQGAAGAVVASITVMLYGATCVVRWPLFEEMANNENPSRPPEYVHPCVAAAEPQPTSVISVDNGEAGAKLRSTATRWRRSVSREANSDARTPWPLTGTDHPSKWPPLASKLRKARNAQNAGVFSAGLPHR